MSDFKCKSGISSDNNQQDINKKDSFDAVNNPAEDSNYNNGINSRYNDKKDYSQASDEGCGCGTDSMNEDYKSSSNSDYMNNDYKSSSDSDNIQYPDDDNTATIYSETIIFAEPFDAVDDSPATSDLVSDQQEGSEFNSAQSNPSKPMC